MGGSLHVAAGSSASGDVRDERRVLGAVVIAPMLIVLAPDFLVVAAVVALVGSVLVFGRRAVISAAQPASDDLLVAGLVFFLAAVWSVVAGSGGFQGALWVARFAVAPIGFASIRATVRRDLRPAIWLGAVAGATSAGVVAAVLVLFARMGRPTSYVNPIHFGELALVLGFVAALTRSLATGDRRRIDRWTLAAIASALAAAVLSHARGGWIALPAILVVACVHQLRCPNRRVLRYVAALVIVTIPVMAVAALANDRAALRALDRGVGETVEYVSTHGGADSGESSVGARFEMSRSAFAGFRAEPVLGIGWGNMDVRFAEDVDAGVRADRIAEHDHPHNQYISHLGSGGLVGFVSLLALLGMPGWICLRAFLRRRDDARALGGAGLVIVVGYAVFALTDSVFETASPLVFYVLAVGTIVAQIDRIEQPRLAHEHMFAYPATDGVEQSERPVARPRTGTL